MNLLPVFQSIEDSGIGRTIRESVWAFAVIESVHLLALSVMGGTVLLVDMRMLNLGLRRRRISELARETQPLMTTALIVLIISGAGLFASEGVKCYYSTPFWVKMTALLIATIYTYTIRRRVVMSAESDSEAGRLKLVAVLSVALWFTVAASGRWIGFSG
jgi:hypothetical protein